MVRCIKYTIFYWKMRKMGELNFSPEAAFWPDVELDGITEDTETDYWHKNLYRALYRVVLAGEVCSRASNEPLFSAVETGASIAESLVKHRAPAEIEITFPRIPLTTCGNFQSIAPISRNMNRYLNPLQTG
jgi:hypothetical protein